MTKNWGKESRRWTKEDLLNNGIREVDPDTGDILITRKVKNGTDNQTKWEKPKAWPLNYPGQRSAYRYYELRHPTDGRCTLNAHRLVWTWFNGEIPQGCVIDHIDHDPGNNSLDNLRLISYEENKARDHLRVGEFIKLFAFVRNHEIVGGAAESQTDGYYECEIAFHDNWRVNQSVSYLKKQEDGLYELDFDFKDSNANWQRDPRTPWFRYIVYLPFCPKKFLDWSPEWEAKR